MGYPVGTRVPVLEYTYGHAYRVGPNLGLSGVQVPVPVSGYRVPGKIVHGTILPRVGTYPTTVQSGPQSHPYACAYPYFRIQFRKLYDMQIHMHILFLVILKMSEIY